MDQLDTLMILKDKFETDVKEHGPDPTAKVEKAIEGSSLAQILKWWVILLFILIILVSNYDNKSVNYRYRSNFS